MGKHCAARRRGSCSPPAASYPPAPTIALDGGSDYTWDGIPFPGLDQFYPYESPTEFGVYVQQAPYDVSDFFGSVANAPVWLKGKFGDGTLFSPFSNAIFFV